MLALNFQAGFFTCDSEHSIEFGLEKGLEDWKVPLYKSKLSLPKISFLTLFIAKKCKDHTYIWYYSLCEFK